MWVSFSLFQERRLQFDRAESASRDDCGGHVRQRRDDLLREPTRERAVQCSMRDTQGCCRELSQGGLYTVCGVRLYKRMGRGMQERRDGRGKGNDG